MARADARRERLDHQRALGRARSKRHYWRRKGRRACGSYEINEELIQALVWNGDLSEADALTTTGADHGVAKLLARFVAEVRARFV